MLSFCFQAGCVNSTSSAGEWLLLNFQSFSASARLEDFIALNPKFDGVSDLNRAVSWLKSVIALVL